MPDSRRGLLHCCTLKMGIGYFISVPFYNVISVISSDILNKDNYKACILPFVADYIKAINDQNTKKFDELTAIVNNNKSFIINIMDVYLVSRLFRNFEPRCDNLVYSKDINYGEPTNIIMHIGTDHAKHIRQILKDLHFIEEYRAIQKDSSCIDITGLEEKK